MQNQNCYQFWRLSKSLKIDDIVALWCGVEPSQFNHFISTTGYSPSCADAKRVAIEDALTSYELDYIDDGSWIGNPVEELIQKDRLRIGKEVLKEWFINKYEQGYLDEIPTFLDDEKQKAQLLSEQREGYIASRQTNEQNTPEQQEIAKLKKEIADLQKQLEERNDKPTDDTLLTAIHDKSNEYHAPDLSHAVKLWSNLYIDGLIGTDSHSNKADRWINSNTSYGNNAEDSSVKRLRQVSTPLKDFGGQRKR